MRWLFGDAGVALGQAALEDDGAFDRIDDAAELRQQAVAHQLEDAAVMLVDLRLEQLLAVRAQPLERPGLILLHEPAVADHVGGEDRGEPAFHAIAPPHRRLAHRNSRIYPREGIDRMTAHGTTRTSGSRRRRSALHS